MVGELQTLIKYTKSIKFEEDPNYESMRQPLKTIFDKNGYEYDLKFDWNAHAEALEKKSTFMHLMDRQNQLARRNSAKKVTDNVKDQEEKYLTSP